MITRTMMLLMCMSLFAGTAGRAQSGGDAILGRWKATEKTLVIEIYRSGPEYHAKIVDFTDHHSSVPAAERTDAKNPDPKLRNRHIIGLDVLYGLHYDQAGKAWKDGSVYDVGSGKEYSAELELDKSGHLNVRAFKGITLLGKTMSFVRP